MKMKTTQTAVLFESLTYSSDFRHSSQDTLHKFVHGQGII